ncbi:MAG: calcium/sodium antiporter [Rhodospirillales bacterium]
MADYMMYLKVAGGFILLLAAADVMVRGAVAAALKLGVTPTVIGMTIVAIGTSAPELFVGVQAALGGAPGLALGNVVGSNIANVLLILGCAALIAPIAHEPMKRDTAFLMGGSLVFAALVLSGTVERWGGFILTAAMAAFLFNSYLQAKPAVSSAAAGAAVQEEIEEIEGEVGKTPKNPLIAWALLLAGMAGILIGSELLVDGAVDMARTFGVSEAVIGLTVIAVGTSLPELAASAAAAFRGHAGLAVGNVVGSNLFNILGVAGVVALVTPLPAAGQIVIFDIWVMLAAAAVMVPVLLWNKTLGRAAGAAFLAVYAAYIAVQAYGAERLFGV